MIWAIGLPRCGGQSLSNAISVITGRNCWHSIEPHRWHDSIQPGDAGACEVYAPIRWLQSYPGRPHTFILNTREKRSWLDSCISVYQESQDNNWNHPIWRYPLEQFSEYYDEWHSNVYRRLPKIHTLDIIKRPRWEELAAVLHLEIPPYEFPRKDRVKNPGPEPSSGASIDFVDPFSFL